MAVANCSKTVEPLNLEQMLSVLANHPEPEMTFPCPKYIDLNLLKSILEPMAEEMGCNVRVLVADDKLEQNKWSLTPEVWLSRQRCGWADSPLLSFYHDLEWGHTPDSDNRWFEFVVLETFQAGLSWKTILRKRLAFRKAFLQFDPVQIANFMLEDEDRLMQNSSIVRNRKKIQAAIENAKIAVKLQKNYTSLSSFFADTCKGKSRDTILSVLQSTFRFVGPTTAESIAFATGLTPAVHSSECWLCQ